MTIAGLDDATTTLGGAVLGPREIEKALGFDPLATLSAAERARVDTLPFSRDELARARTDGEVLVLRIAATPDGPLTMLRLGERLGGGFDPRVHRGVGYQLRDEWTIDAQPFATTETCAVGWFLARREPLPGTLNLGYRVQDEVLAKLGATRPDVPPRRSAIEIAYDTLLWHRAHGERLLAATWDWSRSPSTDQGFAALGEFGDAGLGVIAYSRAVRFGTLGVCTQR
ncbi:MAG TPA: hypothetical protein VGR62_17860 [Candidatus Binatia bacterium]|jgi:hypothetical protein|nr:hypothetical protein [Candidatus Binatia bacterium]